MLFQGILLLAAYTGHLCAHGLRRTNVSFPALCAIDVYLTCHYVGLSQLPIR